MVYSLPPPVSNFFYGSLCHDTIHVRTLLVPTVCTNTSNVPIIDRCHTVGTSSHPYFRIKRLERGGHKEEPQEKESRPEFQRKIVDLNTIEHLSVCVILVLKGGETLLRNRNEGESSVRYGSVHT